jgi:phage shock protein A
VATLWEKFKALFTTPQNQHPRKRPLQVLEEYNEKLFESTNRLAQRYGELREIRAKLDSHAQSLRRILQRFDEQARKHYRNSQVELAEAALREKLKQQTDLKNLETSIEELDKRIDSLRAHKERLQGQLQLYKIRREAMELRYDASKTELETRELQIDLSSDELPDVQSAIAEAENEIRQIQFQLEATRELQGETKPSQKGGKEGDAQPSEDEVAKEIERLRKEILGKKREQKSPND